MTVLDWLAQWFWTQNIKDDWMLCLLLDTGTEIFLVFGLKLLNILPKDFRYTKCSLEDFKTSLDNFLMCIPDLPSCPSLVNMLSSSTGCCAVQWAIWKGGCLTSRDRLTSSENYLLLGFLLTMPSQTVLLSVT